VEGSCEHGDEPSGSLKFDDLIILMMTNRPKHVKVKREANPWWPIGL
jgi:hypothetical protein